MLVTPAAIAITCPLDETVATLLALETQLTVLLILLVDAFEYVPVAVSCCNDPAGAVALPGARLILVSVNAGATTRLALPSLPEKLAVMAAVPPDRPLATPLTDTVATAALAVAQVTELLILTLLPSEKFPVATKLCAPLMAMVGAAGVTVMVFKVAAGKTFSMAEPDLLPDMATTGVLPAETPLTRPLVLTVAIAFTPELQVTEFVILALLPSE